MYRPNGNPRGAGAVAAICLLPALAAAEGFFSEPAIVGGVMLGQSDLQSYSCSGCGSPVGSLDETDTAFGLFAGYQVNPYLGVHAGYVDLGETKASGRSGDWRDKLEADGVFLRVRGTLPYGGFYGFVEAGLFLWDQKVTFASGSFSDSGSFDSTDPMYGIGGGYRFGLWGVEASYTRFQDVGTNDPDLGHENDIDLLSVNVLYHWGL